MKSNPRRRTVQLCVVVLLGSATIGSTRARWTGSDPPSGTQNASSQMQSEEPPGTHSEFPTWNTNVKASIKGYNVISVTNLVGTPRKEVSLDEVAADSFKNWRWTIKADSALLSSWNVYESSDRFKKTALLSADDWSYPAFDWNRGFGRTYLVAKYLLGREPVGLDATVLLIPERQAYHRTFEETEASGIPITLGFPFPGDTSSSKIEQAKRQSTILQAIAEISHQYSRALVDENLTAQQGKDSASREVNREALGACWIESTVMVFMAASGHFRSTIHWNQQSSADDLERRPPSTIPPDKIAYWASLREAESISGYLEMKGLKNRKFSGKDPAPMNAVLSVCRTITQHPVDLTLGPYPPSQIQYVSFFPDKPK